MEFELAGVAVLDLSHPRPAGLPAELFTDDAKELVERPGVDMVVELIGGLDPARTLVEAALRAGRPVVTANKALLAEVRRRAGRSWRRPTASTCSTRRRWPAPSRSSARCASRWPASGWSG